MYAGRRAICDTAPPGGKPRAEDVANARLIAAVLGLLAELEMRVEELRGMHAAYCEWCIMEPSDECPWRQRLAHTDEVIRKAKGD